MQATEDRRTNGQGGPVYLIYSLAIFSKPAIARLPTPRSKAATIMTAISQDTLALPENSSKPDLRRHFRAVRNKAAVDGSAAALNGAKHFLSSIDIPERAVVAGYWPMRSEFDPRPLMTRLSEAGHSLALPVVVENHQPLVFRAWKPSDLLVEGGFKVQVPHHTSPEVLPDVILVPMLAFDAEGYRLGYGGGFYDRTLSKAMLERQVVAVGLAFAAQGTETLPREDHDQKLNWIITEQGTRTFV